MKFVALVSGGKDSFFNILHCQLNGHELQALANLHPPDQSRDELDSFMYQTVGHQALDLYSLCLDVPMFRAPILGSAVVETLSYTETPSDETEDLFQLISAVKKAVPEIAAVSVGAILSNYQRNRVESVCQRLGLVCLAYLWERSQNELVDEIVGSGLVPVIVKTAAYGLDQSHLGQPLALIRPHLRRLNKLCGLHICGEGGEYETLVVDGPGFRKRIEFKNTRVLGSSRDQVYHLAVEPYLVDKPPDRLEGALVAPPPVFDSVLLNDEEAPACEESDSSRLHGDSVYATGFLYSVQDSLEAQAADILSQIQQITCDKNLGLDHVISVTLILGHMGDFQCVNTVYNRFFCFPQPPARVCFEQTLENPHVVAMSAKYGVSKLHRIGLHVQSWSYWAPANIGPYSQGVAQGPFNMLAGQIPLIPSSMELLDSDPINEVRLSFQHLVRVNKVMSGARDSARDLSRFVYVVCLITRCAPYLETVIAFWGTLGLTCPMAILQVTGLPRGARVEWTGVGRNSAINELDSAPPTVYYDQSKRQASDWDCSVETVPVTAVFAADGAILDHAYFSLSQSQISNKK